MTIETFNAYSDLRILRAYAILTGLTDLHPTQTGLHGVIAHNGDAVGLELVILASGAIELRCLSGVDAGERAEVSSIEELRQGFAAQAGRR